MKTTDALIYVVDDDHSSREAIVGLAHSAGFRALGLASASEFLAYPRPNLPGCLVLDVRMPEVSGLDLQRRLNESQDGLPIIFISGHGDVRTSVAALKAGAVDFLTKPFDADGLLEAIRRALPERDQVAPSDGMRGEAAVHGIVGSSPQLQAVLRQVRTVAGTDATVLIQGETGTGKERVARAVHDLSERAGGPFVTVNCSAIPAALLESELLGHERGAFTGATGQRLGRFELAQHGTIFLDEIGELPLDLQPKLLRVLQEREFERLGGSRTVHSDVRVIAATNRDLCAMVTERTFREDLYYRLSVFPIAIPPLRERLSDVPLLAQHFLEAIAARMRRPTGVLTAGSLENLLGYRWPGNIRELQNVLERAVILAGDAGVQVPELGVVTAPEITPPPSVAPSEPPPPDTRREGPAPQALNEVSKAHILRVLNETNWVIAGPSGAAAKLEMKRTTLNFRMKKLGITRRPPSSGV